MTQPAADLCARVLDEAGQRRHDIDDRPDEGRSGVAELEVEVGGGEGESPVEVRRQRRSGHPGAADVGLGQQSAVDLPLAIGHEAVDEGLQGEPVDVQLGLVPVAWDPEMGVHLGRDRSPIDLQREGIDGDDRILEADAGLPIGDFDLAQQHFGDVQLDRQLLERQRDRSGLLIRCGRLGRLGRRSRGRLRSGVGLGGSGHQVVERGQVESVALDGQRTGSAIGGQIHQALDHQLVGRQGRLAQIEPQVFEVDGRGLPCHIEIEPHGEGRFGNRAGRILHHEPAHTQVGLQRHVATLEEAHLAIHVDRHRDQSLGSQCGRDERADGAFIEIDGLEGEVAGLLNQIAATTGFESAAVAVGSALGAELELLEVERVAREVGDQVDGGLVVLQSHLAETPGDTRQQHLGAEIGDSGLGVEFATKSQGSR